MTQPEITIEEEQQQLYTALGKALVQWQKVEASLAFIFVGFVGTGTAPQISNASFHSVQSFDLRVNMVHAAIYVASRAGKRLEDWKPLRNEVLRRYDRRNQLAHFDQKIDPKRKAGHRVVLAPNSVNMKAAFQWLGTPPTLNTELITASGAAFEKSAEKLTKYYFTWVQPLVPSPRTR